MPSAGVNCRTAVAPTTLPASSFQTKLSTSPSGSLDLDPSNCTGVPPEPVDSTVWSRPASAIGGWLVTTEPAIRLKKICETPGVRSCQATLMLPFLSAAICGAEDRPELLERLSGVGKNVAPESVERVKKMSGLPGVLSCQATLILAPASTISHALEEDPALCDRFCALE